MIQRGQRRHLLCKGVKVSCLEAVIQVIWTTCTAQAFEQPTHRASRIRAKRTTAHRFGSRFASSPGRHSTQHLIHEAFMDGVGCLSMRTSPDRSHHQFLLALSVGTEVVHLWMALYCASF